MNPLLPTLTCLFISIHVVSGQIPDLVAAIAFGAGGNMYLIGHTFSPTMQIGFLNLVRTNATENFWVKFGNAANQSQS